MLYFAFSSCMVHSWCMYGVTSGGTRPSFASRMPCLLVTSHPWPGPGGHLTAVLFVSCIPGFIPQQHPNSHPPTLSDLYSGGLLFSFWQLRTSSSLSNQKTVIQWTTTTSSPTRSDLQPSGGVLLLGVSFLGFALSALGYPLKFSIFS